MNRYYKGNLIKVTATFKDSTGTVIDPTVVSAQVQTPAKVDTTYIYGVGGQIIRTGTGVYYININTTSSGDWYCRWYSTGAGQAAAEVHFFIYDSEF